MSEQFLVKKSYCDKCPIEVAIKDNKFKRVSQRKEIQIKSDVENYSNIDYLFLTDTVERQQDLDKFFKFIQNKGIKNFVITSAIGCRTINYELPKPNYTTYNYCNSFDIKKFNPKCVITTGKGYLYFTKSSVFDSWRDFNEFVFNETYFYPHIKSEWKGRIYPSAFIHDIFEFDSFENLHFCKQLEFAKKHVENYEQERFIIPKWRVEKVDNVDQWLEEHKEEEIALDTETNNLNVFVDDFKVGCIQASFDGITGYYLSMKDINKRKFSNWLKDKFQIYANGKYDCKALNRERVSGYHVDEDIPLIFHLMNTERDSNSIKILSWLIGFGGYEDELEEYKKKYKIKNYLDIPENILMVYAGLDAIVTYRLYKFLHQYLVPRQQDTYNLYREVIIPVIPVFQAIEEEGLLVDKEYVKKYHNELVERLSKVEQEIYDIVGKKFNIASNDELGLILREIGLPNYGQTKKGLYQTGEEILLRWKQEGYLIAEKILEYRKISKLDNTYIGIENSTMEENFNFFDKKKEEKEKGIYQYTMSDNRVHGNIMPALTDSWRGLSFQPNLQNFPKQGEEGKAFRKVFIAPEDYYFCEADYSGFQLRLMGIYSKDENMIDAFINKGGDLHSVTGCEIFSQGTDIEYFITHKKEEPYKTARFNGKCFVKGTQIKTNQGNLNIEDFIPEINPGEFTINGNSYIKVLDRFKNEKSIDSTFFDYSNETIEFELENGDIIEITPTHWFPIIRDGKEIKIQAQDILHTDEFIDN